MSKWIGVVEHNNFSGTRIGETLVNLKNVTAIHVTENTIEFVGGKYITVNKESMKMLLDVINTI